MQDISPNSDYELRPSGFFKLSDGSGPYTVASDGTAALIGAGGGGGGGTVAQGAPGTAPWPVNTLARLGAAKRVTAAAAGGASAQAALTASTVRVSIIARGSALRVAVGTGSQTASATTHLIAQDERLDLACAAGSSIAALSDSATAGTLEISELI